MRSIKNKKEKRYDKRSTVNTSPVKVLDDNKKSIIPSIENERDRSIMEILINTGMRVGELRDLNYGTVFADVKGRIVRDTIEVTGKGNKSRTIPMNETAKRAVLRVARYNKGMYDTHINASTALLISRNYNRISIRQIRNITNQNIGVSPHTLRHTAFTDMRNAGVKGEVIQKIAGHSNYNITAKYYISVTTKDLQKASTLIDTGTRQATIIQLAREA